MKTKIQLFFVLTLAFVSFEALGGGPCGSPPNEQCAGATPIAIGGCTGAGCFGEDLIGDPGGVSCGPVGTNSTWFSFVAPASGNVDVTASLTSGSYTPIVLYSGACGALTEEGCYYPAPLANPYTGSFTGLTAGNTYFILMNANSNTYYSSICVADAGGAGGCTLGTCATPTAFALNAPGGGPACTADCNTGALPGPDFAGNNCFDLPNPTVWYTFTTDAAATTIDINLTSATDLSDPEFTLFTTPDCANFTVIDCVEGTAGAASSTGLVVTPSTTYILAVSDVTGDVGNFDLCVTQTGAGPASCTDNEDCGSAATITLNPVGGADACVADCNTGASAGPIFTGPAVCQDMPFPTVWYTFTTGATAALVDITLTSGDLSNPEFALYTNVCGPFTFIACVEGTGGSASVTNQGITANTTYIIAVSDATGDVGNFNLCVSQDINNSACNVDNALTVTSTSMGSPLNGPYAPGEVVNFCYTINTYTTGLPADPQACNYLEGIVPTFGDCWDPASFDAQGMPVNITTPLTTLGTVQPCGAGPPCPWDNCDGMAAGTWSWFPDGAVQYNLANPNALGLTTGDNVGAGWFFLSQYESPSGSCSPMNPETDPNSSYGDNNFPNCDDLGGWTVCFSLIANNATDCLAGETNCNVSIKTFADGEVGVWASIGCTADIPTSFPATMVCVLLSSGLEEFTGKSQEDKNLLSWVINDQLDVDQFRVEKSSDGISWATTGIVEGINNATNYSYTDDSPYANVTYYRLKIKDFNGGITGSQVIAVASPLDYGAGLTSELSPNPASTYFNFTYTGKNLDEDIHIRVVNMVGQTMMNYSVPVTDINEIFEIETSSLSDGIYSVNISQGMLKTAKRIQIAR